MQWTIASVQSTVQLCCLFGTIHILSHLYFLNQVWVLRKYFQLGTLFPIWVMLMTSDEVWWVYVCTDGSWPQLARSHWQLLTYLIIYKIYSEYDHPLYMRKILSFSNPSYLSDLLISYAPYRLLRSISANLLTILKRSLFSVLLPSAYVHQLSGIPESL